MGTVVKKLPILGGVGGYLVEGSQKGVYYIVLSIADLGSILGKTAGNLIKGSSKIIIVTLKSSGNIIKNLQENSGQLLSNTSERIQNLAKLNKKSKKVKRKSKGGYSKRR